KSSLRLLASLILLAAVPVAGAACGMILGIESVEEIQPSGGSGGAGGSGGSGGTCSPPVCGAGWTCGTVDNGCGPVVTCGMCPDGETCRDAMHLCPSDICKMNGYDCGTLPLSGEMIQCPSCKPGFTCSPSHQCGCSPLDCMQRM